MVDADGTPGRLCDVRIDEHGKAVALVELADGAYVRVAFESLEHHADGGYSMRARWRELASGNEHSLSIPVIAERVVAEVREAPAQRVSVKRRVVAETQVVETPLWRERIEVERVPVNEYVDVAPEPRQDGDVLIVPRVDEVVVVEKRLRVTEEVRIRKVRERHVSSNTVELRRHVIDIERTDDAAISAKPKK